MSKYQPINNTKKKIKVVVQSVEYPKLTDEEIAIILKRCRSNLTYVYLLADIQSGILTDIIEDFKRIGIYEHNAKHKINRMRDLAIDMYQDLTKECNEDEKILFGELSDNLKPDIDNFISNLIEI